MSRYIDAVSAAETFAKKTGMLFMDVVDILINIPYADVAPVVHGRWVDGMKCSNCGQVDFSKPNYCPNCGAKMDVEDMDDKKVRTKEKRDEHKQRYENRYPGDPLQH